MFKNTINLIIKKLLIIKDIEIYINYLIINEIFKKYYNNKIYKNDLLNAHSKRNKLIIEWNYINNY